jgi:hypothetical protein
MIRLDANEQGAGFVPVRKQGQIDGADLTIKRMKVFRYIYLFDWMLFFGHSVQDTNQIFTESPKYCISQHCSFLASLVSPDSWP